MHGPTSNSKGTPVNPISNPTRTIAVFAALLLGLSLPVSAQVIDDVEELEWDRPEAWAMKFFNSVSVFTGLGAPRERNPWSFEIGLELDTIPHLSEDQRRIGFGGVKVEDINRLPVFFRPRVTMGLPAAFSVDLAWVPPVEIEGVTSNLVALGLERPFLHTGPWVLGARLSGQLGTVGGDLTCSAEEASHPPGSPGNIWGCEAPSDDELTLNHVSIAFTGGVRVKKTTFHWGLAATYMDMEFQVDAVTDGILDRTLLLASGWTWSVNAGAEWDLSRRLSLAGELFYSPLSVTRPPSTETENDALLNLRTMLRIRF
jgi:hypothetical protein